MKTYTWTSKGIVSGLLLTTDSKLGQVVFLGEEGRGRRYEKVALDRKFPPPVEGGRVLSAKLGKHKIEPPGKTPFEVYRLEREANGEASQPPAAIVRIKTDTGYRKNANGGWCAVTGEPKCVVEGHGAFGDAGRIGGWRDSLVIMTEGDVIKVSPTCDVGGISEFALWLDASGQPQTCGWPQYEREQAKAKVEAIIADAKSSPSKLNLITASIACTTYVGSGRFEEGIKVEAGNSGPAIVLGQEGRGRRKTEVALVGLDIEDGQRLSTAAVVELSRDEKPAAYPWERPVVKVIYGLTNADRSDAETHLVCVSPQISSHRAHVTCQKLAGEPIELGRGNRASGDAGRAGHVDEVLYVLRPGDALELDKARVIRNVDGVLFALSYAEWELEDAKARPVTYIEKGKAPWGHVPAEWVGRVVNVVLPGERVDYTDRRGELCSLLPLTIDRGWDGRDERLEIFETGEWVVLCEYDTVRKLEGEELAAREKAKALVNEVRTGAAEVVAASHFAGLEIRLRNLVERVADGHMLTEYVSDLQPVDFTLAPTHEIASWGEKALAIMAEAEDASSVAKQTLDRVNRGEILVNWKVWHRTGGSTRLGQGWVIRPDGSHRAADSNDCERRSPDGNYLWRQVEPEEIAIQWGKAFTADPHRFTIAKLPVGGLTKQQLEAVAAIEDELRQSYDDHVGGMSDKVCPPVGNGWGLGPKKAPPPPVAKAAPAPVAPQPVIAASAQPTGPALSDEALRKQLAKLGGNGRIKLGGRK